MFQTIIFLDFSGFSTAWEEQSQRRKHITLDFWMTRHRVNQVCNHDLSAVVSRVWTWFEPGQILTITALCWILDVVKLIQHCNAWTDTSNKHAYTGHVPAFQNHETSVRLCPALPYSVLPNMPKGAVFSSLVSDCFQPSQENHYIYRRR